MKKRLVLSLVFALVLLSAAAVSAGTSPWCFDCKCIYDICFCTVETSPGEHGFENCWVQTVLGEDYCVISGWCAIGGI